MHEILHFYIKIRKYKKKKFYLSLFGETNEGELILVDYSGSIYK